MRYSFVADHFQYHAAIAMIVLVASGLSYVKGRMRWAISGVVVAGLGFLTWNQTHIYKDAETLWRDTLAKNPDSWMVWTNVGNALAAQKRYDDAIPYYDQAVTLAPNNRGDTMERRRRVDAPWKS